MIQIRYIKEVKGHAVGTIVNISKSGAESAINAGVAEYVKEMPIEIPERLKGFNFVLIDMKEGEGKKPMGLGWQKKEIFFDNPKLKSHLEAGGNYGVQSNGSYINVNGELRHLIVIDFDKKEFQDKVMPLLPETFTTTSGSSKKCYHLWFASDKNEAFKIKDENKETLCDLIGGGNQIIAPNSKHKSGSIYSIVKDIPFAFIPYAELEALLKPYDKTPKKERKIKTPVVKSINNDVASKSIDAISMSSILQEIGINNSKNPTNCFDHPSRMGQCFSWNDEVAHCFHCDNSWNKFSLVRDAKRLTDKETFEWFAEKSGMLDQLKKDRKKYAEEKEELLNALLGEEGYEEKEEDFLIVNKQGKKIPNEDKLAKYLIKKFNFLTIYGKNTEEIYAFDGKIYTPEKAKAIIKTECERIWGKYCKTKNVSEVLEKIKRSTETDRKRFDDIPSNYIPLENGIFDLNEKVLLPFDSKFPFRFYIPVKYNKTASCPNFLKFLDETLIPEDIPVMQEWFGFSLHRKYFIKKGVICFGLKDTGKTILLKALIRFIGQDNTCGISLQRITAEDKFALSSFYGKLQNIYDDLSSKDLDNGGGFKIVTGGGYITAEYKFGDSFTFLNYAKQTFACNKIPPIKDDDGAYIERWLPIEFLNQVPEAEQDNFLFDKLTTEEELSGILNWALEGLDRLLKNGKFSYSRTKEQVKHLMERSGDFLSKFAEDCLIQAQGERISKELMFELYTAWANKTDSPRISKEQLGRRLENSIKYIISKRDTEERYWEHAKINWDSLKNIINNDTFDTFKKSIREKKVGGKEGKNKLDMLFLKVSNPSQKENPSDTFDTIPKKDNELNILEDFSAEEVQE
jgi:putative DNA primase/helicase